MKYKELYRGSLGMALLRLPVTKKDSVNVRRRAISDTGSMTAAQVIRKTGISSRKPILLCGDANKNLPLLSQLLKMSEKPYVLLGTKIDFGERSCLSDLPTDWDAEKPTQKLPSGSGMITLKPSAQTNVDLKVCLPEWDSHLIVMCLGNGLQLDTELINLLHAQGSYILLTESLFRSVKSAEGNKLTPSELMASMSYLVISSAGSGAKELLSVLPHYEQEKITNTTDLSGHGDSPYQTHRHHHRGLGLRLSQSRTLETKPILTQEQLTDMQNSHITLIYNAETAQTWTAKITR